MLAFLCAVVVVEHHLRAVVAHGVLQEVAAREEAGEGDAAVQGYTLWYALGSVNMR